MTRLVWSKPSDRQFETGLDRGVLYMQGLVAYSAGSQTVGNGSKTFALSPAMGVAFKVGSKVRAYKSDTIFMLGTVTASSTSSVTLNVFSSNGGPSFTNWTLVEQVCVAWNGLTSVDESGGETAASYYIDGRPFLFLPKPKEFAATLKAFTYPDAFSSIMGLVEATDGMYLDSQQGDSFGLAYRTLVGDGVSGTEAGYKIHLLYNVTVVPSAVSYASLGSDVNPVEFSWPIQAVPVAVDGYRATAHIVIDTRHMDPIKLAELEALLYGDSTSDGSLPDPQTIFDTLSYGDAIVIIDNGDGTWTAIGSYRNIYMIGDGIFEIDNVNAVDNGNGTFTISSTP